MQDRFVKEMRLLNICSIEEAQPFLEQYRLQHNQRFAKPPKSSLDHHRPIIHGARELDLICSKQHLRKLSKSLSCQYNNTQYLIKTKNPSYAMRGASIIVCELLDGEIVLLYKGRELPYQIHQEHSPLNPPQDAKTIGLAVDQVLRNQTQGQTEATHPWKRWNPDYFAKQE